MRIRRNSDGTLSRPAKRHQLEPMGFDNGLFRPNPDAESVLARHEWVLAVTPRRVVSSHLQLEDVPFPSAGWKLLQPGGKDLSEGIGSPEPSVRIRCGHSVTPFGLAMDAALNRVENQPTGSIIASIARRSGAGGVGHAEIIVVSSGDGSLWFSVHLLVHPGGDNAPEP